MLIVFQIISLKSLFVNYEMSEDNFRQLNVSELRELKLNELGIYN